MSDPLWQCVLLAQNAQPPAPPAGQNENAFGQLMFMLVAFGLLMYFFLLRPQKRKEQQFRQMIAELKENDHVVTAGGIHGVVTNVQRDAERVTIRVDEATGTKLRVSMGSIARVITDQGNGNAVTAGDRSK